MQPPAPFHVTPRGFAGPNLLAVILCGVSSGMLNYWVSTGDVGGSGGKTLMARLLDGPESIRRSLPETELGKQSMKLYNSNPRNAVHASHVGTERPIQHPLCNHRPP